jgi:hypothetical protein
VGVRVPGTKPLPVAAAAPAPSPPCDEEWGLLMVMSPKTWF